MRTSAPPMIKMPLGFWESIGHTGITAGDLAQSAGLPLSIVRETDVTAAQYFAIWQAYADLSGDTARGIVRLVGAFAPTAYPPPVIATYHERTYRDALYRMARYKKLCPPEGMSIREDGEQARIELDWRNPNQPGPPILMGNTLAFLVELGRRGSGYPVTPRLVEIRPLIGDPQILEAYFGCPVRQGAARNRLTFDRKELDRPFTSRNEELLEVLTPALDQTLASLRETDSVQERVKQLLKGSLPSGRVDLHSVARELGMSERNLQRRLAEKQTSFKDLTHQARHELARAYLADSSLEIKEVAFLLGYEDQNSFYRAFRSWEGEPPGRWRSRHAAGRHPSLV
ncbi:AraC family transcriptional regulator ligand-binding domain-containing protein [Gorillibacterium sp. sgz500922]|uniref:AraC family transcriptional regulator ligand-binding domain-containing protein n=1 Tax=Gorillibacterium sp. sgz500922 TaxID=3446694 RepID=UPI003F6754FF